MTQRRALSRHTLRAAAVIGALALALAACGDDDDDSAAGGDTTDTTEAPAPACEVAQAQPSGSPDTAPLKIGAVLPETGSLNYLGPPEFAGAGVAIDEINDAGGVLGNPVTLIRGDSGDATTDTGNQTVDRQLGAGAQAFIGPASSEVTKLIIDKITSAGSIQLSTAATSDEFTCWQDRGLFFRTAPPDLLQAQALADLMASDGAQRVSILARNDPYGAGLANNAERDLRDAGIPADALQKIIYDPNAASFNAEVDRIRQFNPDAIAVIGFDESKRIITRMAEVQIGPAQKKLYGTDGNTTSGFGSGLAPGLLNGMKGTTPLTQTAPEFQQRVRAQDPGLQTLNYSGESYDAVMLIALAAEQAKSTKGVDMAAVMNDLTQGGEKCTNFESCKAIIDAGGDVDYDGTTGTLDFVDAGEPGSGSYAIETWGPNNRIDESQRRFVVIG